MGRGARSGTPAVDVPGALASCRRRRDTSYRAVPEGVRLRVTRLHGDATPAVRERSGERRRVRVGEEEGVARCRRRGSRPIGLDGAGGAETRGQRDGRGRMRRRRGAVAQADTGAAERIVLRLRGRRRRVVERLVPRGVARGGKPPGVRVGRVDGVRLAPDPHEKQAEEEERDRTAHAPRGIAPRALPCQPRRDRGPPVSPSSGASRSRRRGSVGSNVLHATRKS